jgi:uncharacterized protein (TIGR02117 family)
MPRHRRTNSRALIPTDHRVLAKAFKALSTLALFVLVIVTIGILVPRPIWVSAAPKPVDWPSRILVLSNPIHTDIAIPVNGNVLAQFGFLSTGGLDLDNPNLRYLIFGWGGRAFYTQTPTWADLKTVPVVKSLTLDRAVMHVELAGDIPFDRPEVSIIDIDAAGFDRLLTFIRGSFTVGENGPIPLLGSAYGNHDAFFEGEGYFNALAGCNTWTAAALRHAGLTSGWWTVLPWMLRVSLWLHNDPTVFAPPRQPAGQPG